MCFCFNYFDCGFYRKIPIFYNHGIIELKCFQCEVWWSVWKLVPTHQTEPSLFWEVAFNLDSAGIPPSIFYFWFWFFLDGSSMATAFSWRWRSLRAAVATSDICVSHTATKLGAHSRGFHRFILLLSSSVLRWLNSTSVQSAVAMKNWPMIMF